MAVRAAACGGLALCVAVTCATVPAAATEIRDWPCDTPFAERFTPEAVWGGPLPAAPPDRSNAPAVREVVAFAADPENPPGQGERRIAAFAHELGADRRDSLLAVFAGLLTRFDTLRGFVIEGVRDYVLRAKILHEAVERHDVALAALPAERNGGVEARRQGYLEARFWDARRMDDALEEAEFLCRRYDYLGEKLNRLTAAIKAAW
jgi:hypothetical protein